MLRIVAETCICGERFELQGRLVGPYVLELERAVREARLRSPHISLEASQITFLDEAGARLLRELRTQGVEVRGCSAFVAALLGSSGSP